MKNLLFVVCMIFMIIACTKNKYEFTNNGCDLSNGNIKYSTRIINQTDTIEGIEAILATQCNYSCHANPPSDSTSSYDYTTYSGVKRAAGSIYDRINRSVSDPLHMPKGQTMQPCDIEKINVWILTGAPDN